MGFAPRGCLPEVRWQMQPMGSEIALSQTVRCKVTSQRSNQIAPNVLSHLHVLFMQEIHHNKEVRYFKNAISGGL